ncbi:hypothetical protein NBM05_14410 [Rothia sp. AR01]|uniref:DoxX family membrane protein n=1 Tax=Rothia santali TaxID=2949643 RepID=A0A9X2HCM3_9MICC|nr:hypothetical protein [Rothia santali]MCP3427169.1 hypothetical protein [Rothia santali]
MAFSLSNTLLRGIPGAYILNAGVEKLSLDEQTAGYLQSMAAKGFPALEGLDAATFGKALAGSEVAVGAALLAPFVPTRLAGLALGAFSAGMLTMYFKTEEFTQDNGVSPSQAGTPVSHNVWLAAIAAALLLQRKGGKKGK